MVSATGHLIKASLLTKPSYSSYRRYRTRRLLFCWGNKPVLEEQHSEL